MLRFAAPLRDLGSRPSRGTFRLDILGSAQEPSQVGPGMANGDLNWIANYIWSIADDVLRDLYVRGKYRDVILPMAVLRRLDAVLADGKQAVLDMKTALDDAGIVEQDTLFARSRRTGVLQHVEVHAE